MTAQEYVGMDLHRERSVLVRTGLDGEVIGRQRLENSPAALREAIAEMGPNPKVAVEATYGWYWAADVLEEAGAEVHLAHPLMVKALGATRVKNDRKDARLLADLLRANLLPESWVAPGDVRQARELVRYRQKLVWLHSGLRSQVHAVLAKEGVRVPMSDLFGVCGEELLETLTLEDAYRERVVSLGRVLDVVDGEIAYFDQVLRDRFSDDPGWHAIQVIRGIGPVLASIFCAEIGDIHRFRRPERLASWAGLTPRHRESDTKVVQGHITKQGSRLVRWAAVEAVTRYRPTEKIDAFYNDILSGHGKGKNKRIAAKIARVAAARKLLSLVYWGLRDHHIRALEKA